MDPNATLRDIVRMARDLEHDESDGGELAEAVLDLIDWLKRGGFPPDWSAA